jgi:hypothetical protein
MVEIVRDLPSTSMSSTYVQWRNEKDLPHAILLIKSKASTTTEIGDLTETKVCMPSGAEANAA